MNALLLSARMVLAAVFLVASLGKFFDLKGARHTLEEFGVPASIARLASRALPVAELAAAVALLVRPSARWGAAAALMLLLVLTAGVARSISQGRTPECHCFGQIHSEPAGPSTLVRNVILAAVAVLIVAGGTGPSVDGGLGSLDGTQGALVASVVVAALLAVAVAKLRSDKRRLQAALDSVTAASVPPGLPPGTPAPEFALTAVRGPVGSLGGLIEPARPAVLVFVSTSCGPCLEMLPALARWQESLAASVALTAIFAGQRADIERLSGQGGLSAVLAQEANETFELYALRATPSAVLVHPDGVIGGAPAEGRLAIEALIRSALA